MSAPLPEYRLFSWEHSYVSGKDELRASLLMTFLAAPTDFVRLLAAGPTNFLYALQARERQLDGK